MRKLKEGGDKTMLIGERIKSARYAAHMSQDELGKEIGVSKAAISNYERGKYTPDSEKLMQLAKVLSVKFEYFVRPVSVKLTLPSYRKRVSLPRKEEKAIRGRVREWLERYLDIENLLGHTIKFDLPSNLNRKVTSLDKDVERIAYNLRQKWELGLAPIENLTEELEDQGIKVGIVPAHSDFDALTFLANDEIPVIVLKKGLPGDRQRYNLAHELGHLILEPAEDINDEKVAHRFAGAFLVPEPMVYSELGKERHYLDLKELYSLKRKYGLPMQGWIYRAKDLGVITPWVAQQMFKRFRQEGWHKQEPYDPLPEEHSERFERLVRHGLVEGIISEIRAAELLGVSMSNLQEKVKEHVGTPTTVRR